MGIIECRFQCLFITQSLNEIRNRLSVIISGIDEYDATFDPFRYRYPPWRPRASYEQGFKRIEQSLCREQCAERRFSFGSTDDGVDGAIHEEKGIFDK